jgi:hypothetical protein
MRRFREFENHTARFSSYFSSLRLNRRRYIEADNDIQSNVHEDNGQINYYEDLS